MTYYYRVVLEKVPREIEDILTLGCFEWGASGVSEDLQFKQSEHNYEPRTVISKVFTMQAYFEAEVPEAFFDWIETKYPKVNVKVFREPNKDWLEEWKKDFKAFSLVDDAWVVPSWLPTPDEAKIPIKIDPGMAFGTGTHATTQIAAQFIARLCSEKPPFSLLDVGTGTGVLAILAEKLGVRKIQAKELDPVARNVARENLVLNGASNILVVDEQVEDLVDRSDIVVANIIDGVLVKIQDHLKRLCRPEGYLVLTGILKDRENSFRKKFGLNDSTLFEVEDRIEKEGWVGYLVRRKN
ncbi:MAG: 50S ribosomal protein L11 methyltransferase [Bdellovibrionales bacterium]